MSQNPNLFLSIGKQVKDEYGRVIGKIASFAVTPSGKFDAVFVEQGDGKFLKHSTEHLKVDGANITLTSKTKTDAGVLCDQIPLLWRKDQALADLNSKKKITPEVYSELHSAFDGALTELKSNGQSILDNIDKEIVRCAEEIKALNYAVVNLEIEHEIGRMDNKYYETAFTILQDNLKLVHLEKGDLEVVRNKLSNILLGDKSTPVSSTPSKSEAQTSKTSTAAFSSPELPEPPVVVYVKEVGKTGI